MVSAEAAYQMAADRCVARMPVVMGGNVVDASAIEASKADAHRMAACKLLAYLGQVAGVPYSASL